MAFCRRYSYAITGVLMAAGATTSAASHVREGKDVAYHDGNLRYPAAQPYDEGSCGFPQWVVTDPGAPVPSNALVAGRDNGICDGTMCGKNLYVVSATSSEGVELGKTWFTRTDGACASLSGSSSANQDITLAQSGCRVLTMGSGSHNLARFGWAHVEASGNENNRFEAPPHALVAGNHYELGPLYSCRFVDDKGGTLVGQTWFPRHDGACCSAEYGGSTATSAHCEILTEEPCQ